MTEQVAADTFLYGALSDPEIVANGVHAGFAPDGTEPEYIVFSTAVSRDVIGNGRTRQYTEIDYTIRAVTIDDKTRSDAIEESIDLALNDQHVDQNGFHLDCIRLSPLVLVATQTGRNYRYSGGRYRITVRKLL